MHMQQQQWSYGRLGPPPPSRQWQRGALRCTS
jgi:hypothetical protein